MSTQIERERQESGEERPSEGTSRSQRAVVRLWGVPEIPPETLLAMAEGLRRALRLVGVVNVDIELEGEDAPIA